MSDFTPHTPEDPAADPLKAALKDLPRNVAPPADLWPGIAARIDAPARIYRLGGTRRLLWFSGVAALLVLGIGIGVWMVAPPAGPSWAVAALAGTPRVDARGIAAGARLGVGDWLETDATARAEVTVADIGTVVVEPNSRLQLQTTQANAHRIALERGRIQASILAPPRLFMVETPSATAVDMGCAYTLEVDADGAGLLHVTAGWVALERDARAVLVPARALSRIYAGQGPGTPYFEDASAAFKAALERYETTPNTPDLNVLLTEARSFDTLTLWHLLPTAEGPQRARLFEKIAGYHTPPEGVTRAQILALDPDALDAWLMDLEFEWIRG